MSGLRQIPQHFAGRFTSSGSRWLARRVLLSGIALLLLTGVTRLLYSDFERDREQRDWLTHTREMLNATNTLSGNLQEIELAHRGYLLTGDQRYLHAFDAAAAAEPAALDRVLRAAAGELSTAGDAAGLRELIADRLRRLHEGIEMRRRSDFHPSAVPGLALDDQPYLQGIRRTLYNMEAGEQRWLAERSAAADANANRMRWLLGSGTAVLLILLLISESVIERDIREREETRRELERSEQTMRALVESAPQAIVGVGANGVILSANAATGALFGYANHEIVGQPLELLIPESARAAHREHWARYVAAPGTRPMGIGGALAGKRKDGSEFPAEIGLGHIEPRTGPLFVAFITDTTVRERAITALRKTEADLRRYMDSAPAAIATFDRNMSYLAVSQRFREDYRLGTREIIGISHYEIFPEIPAHWRAVHQRCLAGAVERNDGERFVRADGTEQWVRWEMQPWHQADGSIGGVVLLSEDITPQKRAEEEILRLNASLEQRVRERTAELEATNRELKAFSYSVSHDLRAPLRGIEGWSRALLEDYGAKLDEGALVFLGRVRSETERLESLIDGMLRLSNVWRAEMHREAVDLSSMIEMVAGRLQEEEQTRRIEFRIEPGLTVTGDANLLEIAATNLMANAVKFTAPRAPARIEFGRASGEGERVFYIRDNGVGFDMAYAGNLFTAFERLHKAPQFPGTGIGLATVQRVIHRHGGRVWAEAQPEKGATFYFTIGVTQ